MKNIYRYLFTPVLVLSLVISLTSKGNSTGIYKRLTAVQCDSLIKANAENPQFVILDVRTPGEWESGHIEGSINRSTRLSDFTAQLDQLPKHKTFLMHCQSGGRSAGAFQQMKDFQFAEVYEMIGGLNAWNNSGFPLTTGSQPRLMLVDYRLIHGAGSDTMKITVTNRANGQLAFSSALFDDPHPVVNNFEAATMVQGAFDYTFSLVHTPQYHENDSTRIQIASNGGNLDFTVVLKNGIIQGVHQNLLSGLKVFPNPARELLNIYSGIIPDEISVYNLQGQIVLKKRGNDIETQINVSGWNNGIYLLKLKTGHSFQVKKFIVSHPW